MTTFAQLTRVYTACRDCHKTMQVIDRRTVHPLCTPRRTAFERTMRALSRQYIHAVEHDQDTTELENQINALDATQYPPNLARAAVRYAEWGWPVFPLARHSKMPAIPKRRGGRGFKDATADPERIKKWWDKHPAHNIGLATGHLFDVIDIDPRNGGIPTLMDRIQAGGLPEIHAIATTSGGGNHLYVKSKHRASYTSKLHPGIDYKSLGGYVVAPPSWLGAPERSYTWQTVPSPEIRRGR